MMLIWDVSVVGGGGGVKVEHHHDRGRGGDYSTVEPLYKGHHRGMKFWPLWRGGLNSGVFSKIFQTKKHTKNNRKWDESGCSAYPG